MNWYYVDAGKQAGPVDDAGLYALAAGGRITNETLVWSEGMADWQPFGNIRHGLVVMPPEPGAAPAGVTEQDVLGREYRIDIGSAMDRGWKTFTGNAGTTIGTLLLVGIVFLVGLVISAVFARIIPFSNLVINFFFAGPLMAGFTWFSLKLVRGEPAGVGDGFAGFTTNYWQLVLFGMVQLAINFVCLLPLGIVIVVTGIGALIMGHHTAQDLAAGVVAGLVFGGALAFCLLLFINTLWTYVILLIMDKNYGFWAAMQLSARMVIRRWWMTFLFTLVAFLLYMLGALLCGVGVLATGPLLINMLAILYDDNFRDLEAQR
jgi:hypothetical protein